MKWELSMRVRGLHALCASEKTALAASKNSNTATPVAPFLFLLRWSRRAPRIYPVPWRGLLGFEFAAPSVATIALVGLHK
jgi:hypothetical protein